MSDSFNGITLDIWARFWSKVDVLKKRQCWNWRSSTSNGYGQFSVNGRPHSAHVLSYVFKNGQYDRKLWIDHVCMNRKCVNPAHLRAVSPRINSIENSNSWGYRNHNKTHCINGHEFTEENTSIRIFKNSIHRKCIKCRRECGKRNREKAREAQKAVEELLK